jgi:hypothetical protein
VRSKNNGISSTLNKQEEPNAENDATGAGDSAELRRHEDADLVDKVIQKYKEKVDHDKVTLSVGDLIRLMQYRKELETEDPKEIKATWVEPTEKEPATET